MANIKVITIPQKREKEEVTKRIHEIVSKQNKIIAKQFNFEELEITVKIMDSTGSITSNLGPNKSSLGVFNGYVDCTKEILIINPHAVEGLFTKLWEEMEIIIVNSLVRLYLCNKYFPNENDFKMYHKYLSEVLSDIISGKYKLETANFDFKMHTPGKFYKKDKELGLILSIMKKRSGIDFIFEHLNTIMEDLNIKKSIKTIYNKNIDELIKPETEEVIEEERKLRKAFNKNRRR